MVGKPQQKQPWGAACTWCWLQVWGHNGDLMSHLHPTIPGLKSASLPSPRIGSAKTFSVNAFRTEKVNKRKTQRCQHLKESTMLNCWPRPLYTVAQRDGGHRNGLVKARTHRLQTRHTSQQRCWVNEGQLQSHPVSKATTQETAPCRHQQDTTGG